MSSTDPTAPDSKPSEKEKPGDATLNPDQNETPTKDAKQKGEKRKAEPGKATPTTREEKPGQYLTMVVYDLSPFLQ